MCDVRRVLLCCYCWKLQKLIKVVVLCLSSKQRRRLRKHHLSAMLACSALAIRPAAFSSPTSHWSTTIASVASLRRRRCRQRVRRRPRRRRRQQPYRLCRSIASCRAGRFGRFVQSPVATMRLRARRRDRVSLSLKFVAQRNHIFSAMSLFFFCL